MTDELRWGILGCGRIASDFARAMRNCQNNNRVVAVAASNLERADEFVENLHLDSVKTYGNYEELLMDPFVDIVYVALLNMDHCKWTIRALEANKHVLCEKPFAVNANQARMMIEMAKRKGKFLMEAVWTWFFPVWRDIRKIIASEEMGAVRLVNANLGVEFHSTRLGLEKAETPLMAAGFYTVALALMAFNYEFPKKVQICGDKDENGVDKWGSITLDFGQGRHACLYYGGFCWSATSASVTFDKGQIQVPRFFWCPDNYIKIDGLLRAGRTQEKAISYPLSGDPQLYNNNNSAGMCYEIDHVYEQIKAGRVESDIVPLDKTVQVAELMDLLRSQIDLKFPQDLEEKFHFFSTNV
ncbi:Trans-1,2-dihydrobenzene-1,2-diol dehydrogenase-like [Aphelenchoides bicaudatus]|nr:Trans-1,2-dihydrobenzene-1,2-diol dehydrogenase-like [Aphelenchoides bicaudatus]